MSGALSGRVALVTGASRGIGRSVARELGTSGAYVAVNYARDAEAAAETVRIVQEDGGRSISVQADVAVADEVAALVDQVEERLGPVDILVNNAGITRDGLFVRMPEEDWDAVVAVSLKGAFLTSKAVSRGMMKRRQGSIINVSSVVGRRGNAGQANYGAAKAGLIGLTKSLARELAPRNVRVNAVAPGYVETEMTGRLVDDAREAIRANTPLGRFGTPEDVARAVHYLASDEASFVTGVVLPVDGGLGM